MNYYEELIKNLKADKKINIKGNDYDVLAKTWHTMVEMPELEYVKCQLSEGKVLVVLPKDEIIFFGYMVENIKYKKIDNKTIEYNGEIMTDAGNGTQIIKQIEFGDRKLIEGNCICDDWQSDTHYLSLGILTEENNKIADIYAEFIGEKDITF